MAAAHGQLRASSKRTRGRLFLAAAAAAAVTVLSGSARFGLPTCSLAWQPNMAAKLGGGSVAVGVAVTAAMFVALILLPMLPALLCYYRTIFFFWTGGAYARIPKRWGLSALSRAHLYSLASVPWLMVQPHYRTGSFQQDMLTNLSNVVLPTRVYGVPLNIFARSRASAVFAILVAIPGAAFVGSLWRRWHRLEDSARACFRQSLLEPKDWFQLWRLNCRLASMTALATQSKDFLLEDKWVFIKSCQEKGIPVTPVMDMPHTLVAKDVLEEGGMGIHVLKNVVHGGRWILQEKLDNCEAVNQLLPDNAPLSTLRVVTGSRGALSLLGAGSPTQPQAAKALCTVWRAGRAGASTDHSSVMVDVPDKSTELLGTGSSSAHWYARGWKSFGMPLSTADGAISKHPDTAKKLTGERLVGASDAAALCERAHASLMPTVPLAGWDVAFCTPKNGASQPELVLLEANLSCNFFRGNVAWDEYGALVDEHFAAIDTWRQRQVS